MKGLLQLFMGLVFFQSVHAQKDCRHGEYEEKILATHPQMLNTIMGVNALSSVKAKDGAVPPNSTPVPEVITIQVVVHILYNNPGQNISREQVNSQIDALNRDFRGTNADLKNIPVYFSSLTADCGIAFKLATVDPEGQPTTGIIRKPTSIQYFGLDDRAKSSSRGGDDGWDATRYLNIWVCNLAGGVLGYSSTPGGPLQKDGVVINLSTFGTIGNIDRSFALGRTATHEIGHWLNLRHIWGDTYCGDDKVDDTPQQRSSNRGCPSGKKFGCTNEGNGEMYMNFMDLTDDACMYTFTKGQRERMRSLFEEGGFRHSMLAEIKADTVKDLPATNTPVVAAQEKVSINLYPNPVSNMLTVSFELSEKDDNSKRELVLYNHTGKPVLRETMMGGMKTFNISQLSSGLYYIHIIQGNSVSIRKFMKL